MSKSAKAWLLPWAFCSRLCVLLALAVGPVQAGPLALESVPAPLRPWVAWALEGNTSYRCPANAEDGQAHFCLWPRELALDLTQAGGQFQLDVTVYAPATEVPLPGEAERWPQEVRANGAPVPVVEAQAQPALRLDQGTYRITGVLRWAQLPQNLPLPPQVGLVRLRIDGAQRSPQIDAKGRLWLREERAQGQDADAATLRTFRLLDDDLPARLDTHFELSLAGKPREVKLAAALLPGFVPEALDSPLPARLGADGVLTLQARAGNWAISLRSRRSAPLLAVRLPAQARGEEVWSIAHHNALRLVQVTGVPAVDPRQVSMPEAWKGLPAYRLRPGETLRLSVAREGAAQADADRLSLARELWLDFDGGGYTFRDHIVGSLSRNWRLEALPPAVLGRVSLAHVDQPVTRRQGGQSEGVEVRHGQLDLSADGRLEGRPGAFSAGGWAVDFRHVAATVHLPPGWRLLHALGVDQARGSWVSAWTLWDFFFVLLCALGAGRLFGWGTGALLGAALVLSWHMPHAPGLPWVALLGFLGARRALPEGRLRLIADWGARACFAVIALLLVPYAVEQCRFSLHPGLASPLRTDPPPAVESDHVPPSRERAGEAPAAPAAADAPESIAKKALVTGISTDSASSQRVRGATLAEVDPGVTVPTGPGLPTWTWTAHQLRWQGPVEQSQQLHLLLLPPAGEVALRLGGLALLLAALWAVGRRRLSSPPASVAALGVLALALAECARAGSGRPGCPNRCPSGCLGRGKPWPLPRRKPAAQVGRAAHQ